MYTYDYLRYGHVMNSAVLGIFVSRGYLRPDRSIAEEIGSNEVKQRRVEPFALSLQNVDGASKPYQASQRSG